MKIKKFQSHIIDKKDKSQKSEKKNMLKVSNADLR